MGDFIIKYWLEFAFGIVSAALGAGYARLSKRVKAERKKNQAIEDGVRDILRMQILDTYDSEEAAMEALTAVGVDEELYKVA